MGSYAVIRMIVDVFIIYITFHSDGGINTLRKRFTMITSCLASWMKLRKPAIISRLDKPPPRQFRWFRKANDVVDSGHVLDIGVPSHFIEIVDVHKYGIIENEMNDEHDSRHFVA
jgi:hypothetical protein